MSATTGERRRLTRSADFDAVYRRGRSRATRHLVVYVFPREPSDAAPARVGLAVSRKVGGAVERNRVKRQLREAIGELQTQLPTGADLVVTARAGLHETLEAQGLAWLVGELAELLRDPPGGEPA